MSKIRIVVIALLAVSFFSSCDKEVVEPEVKVKSDFELFKSHIEYKAIKFLSYNGNETYSFEYPEIKLVTGTNLLKLTVSYTTEGLKKKSKDSNCTEWYVLDRANSHNAEWIVNVFIYIPGDANEDISEWSDVMLSDAIFLNTAQYGYPYLPESNIDINNTVRKCE